MGRKISLSIKRSALKENWFVKGANDEYIAIDAYENDVPDKYGNQWSLKQTPPQDVRADMKQRGERIPYCGNGKEWENKKPESKKSLDISTPLQKGPINLNEDVPF